MHENVLQGIYPTLLVVLISLAESTVEKTSNPTSNFEYPRRGSGAIHDRIGLKPCTESDSMDNGPSMLNSRTDSVLMIGSDATAFDSRTVYSAGHDEVKGRAKEV